MDFHNFQIAMPIFMAGVGVGFFGGIAWIVGFGKRERL